MKPSPDQQTLPFDATYRERFALLDAIDYQRSGLTQTRWKNVRALLKAIHRADQGNGCWASTDWLADACEYSRRTLFRARDDAIALDLIDIEHRARKTGNGGRDSNLWQVRWKQVGSLGQQIDAIETINAASREVKCQDAEVKCQVAEVKCQVGTAIIRNSSKLSSPGRDGSGATKNFAWTDAQQSEAWGVRSRLIRAVGPLRDRRDLLDATKAVMLSLERYGERWLWDAANAVGARGKPPKRPWAFFRRVLDENTRDLGDDLNRMFARCDIPPSLLETPKREADLSERLCATGPLEDA